MALTPPASAPRAENLPISPHNVAAGARLSPTSTDVCRTPCWPRHSRRMTHLCSDRVTHTKNRLCPWARSEQAISSTPKACKVFGSAGPSRQLHVCTGPAREQPTTQVSVVVGHFGRAKYGHFSRVPKRWAARRIRGGKGCCSQQQSVNPAGCILNEEPSFQNLPSLNQRLHR